MTEPAAAVAVRRRWNWWKIGFFAMLIAFEVAREFAVLVSAEGVQPTASKMIYGDSAYVIARGRWLRSDGGSQLTPGVVTIECRKDSQQCLEASVSTYQKGFFPPELDWFPATFTPQGVSYVNDNPTCARYAVHIDLMQQRAFATRDRKANPANEVCAKLEPRIAMELGDGYVSDPHPFKGHFVPLLQILVWALQAGD